MLTSNPANNHVKQSVGQSTPKVGAVTLNIRPCPRIDVMYKTVFVLLLYPDVGREEVPMVLYGGNYNTKRLLRHK